MSDIGSISGKALLDRNVFISLLAQIEPKTLDENSTLFHIGYEKAKLDMLDILARSMGPEFSRSKATQLLMALRDTP